LTGHDIGKGRRSVGVCLFRPTRYGAYVEEARSMRRHETEHKTFAKPDETRQFPHGRAEIIKVGGGEVGRFVFQPGWRWSNDVKPIAKTESCQAPTSSIM
jgi:hypothetical protein